MNVALKTSMKVGQRAGWLVLALLAAGSTFGAAASTTDTAALATQVMRRVAAEAGFNGAVVLMREGEVVFRHAVGLAQRNPDRPFTVDTPSDGGSLAKTLTAALVWELAAEGRLSLDDPVTRHLPDYPYPEHRVRTLVSHRSGLPDYDFFDAELKSGKPLGTPDLLAGVVQRKPADLRPQGVEVEYSNLGFDFAALIVERITGQGIGTVLRERYFARLGMAGAFARPARFADFPVPRTAGYMQRGGRWQPHDSFDGEGFVGASNVHASALDWARWGDAFARGGVMPAERLEAGLREPMLASGMDSVLTRLSWYCDGTRQRCHYTGHYNGFYAQVWWDRTRREVVAYVSNSTLPAWQCARLTRDLIDALAGRAPAAEPLPKPAPVKARELRNWAGRYRAPGLGEVVIDAGGPRPTLRVAGGERASLFPVPGGVFYAPTLDLWLAFGGTPREPRLHLRSVFLTTDARREPAGPT